jgi:cell wall-associated NlpC family hydrolase
MKLSPSDIKKLITYAKTFIGVPYKYGATMSEAPVVFDCSGFIKYIFSYMQVELPRSSIEQASFGKIVKNIAKLETGMLFFFGDL